MKQHWFKKEITIGTVLQLLTMISLALGAYHKFDARLTATEAVSIANTNRLDRHDTALNSLANSLTKLDTMLEERTRPKL